MSTTTPAIATDYVLQVRNHQCSTILKVAQATGFGPHGDQPGPSEKVITFHGIYLDVMANAALLKDLAEIIQVGMEVASGVTVSFSDVWATGEITRVAHGWDLGYRAQL